MVQDYKQLYSQKHKAERELKSVCPEIKHTSGIYFLTRIQPKAYIGKSVDEIDRMSSHILGYEQHIDKSLKKRGFYSKEKPYGWKLNVLHFPKEQLDEKERYYIDLYKQNGYELLNIESGGTTGKTMINDRKPPKGYRDGLAQGYKNAQNFIAKLFEKNLVCEINGTPNKNKQKALEKFEEFIKKG